MWFIHHIISGFQHSYRFQKFGSPSQFLQNHFWKHLLVVFWKRKLITVDYMCCMQKLPLYIMDTTWPCSPRNLLQVFGIKSVWKLYVKKGKKISATTNNERLWNKRKTNHLKDLQKGWYVPCILINRLIIISNSYKSSDNSEAWRKQNFANKIISSVWTQIWR